MLGGDADDAGHGEEYGSLDGSELYGLFEMGDAGRIVGGPGGFHIDVSGLLAELIGGALPLGAVVVVECDAAEEEGLSAGDEVPVLPDFDGGDGIGVAGNSSDFLEIDMFAEAGEGFLRAPLEVAE